MCGKIADWDVYNIKVTLASSLHFISGQEAFRQAQASAFLVLPLSAAALCATPRHCGGSGRTLLFFETMLLTMLGASLFK